MTASSHLPRASAEAIPWAAFRRRLLSFVTRRTADGSDAEDIVQTVLGRAASELEAGRQHGDVVAWLFQMTRNALTDHYRRRARRERQLHTLAAAVGESTGLADVPDEEPAGLSGFADCVRPMVAALPEPYGMAVRRVDLEGISQVGLAAELGLSTSGAKSRVQRGRAMLRDAFLRCCIAERDPVGSAMPLEAERCSPHAGAKSCVDDAVPGACAPSSGGLARLPRT